MDEALTAVTSVRNASAAQAGKLLCVSETIYPHGPRHGVNLIYGGIRASGGLRPSSYVRVVGEEFVDLRALVPSALARLAGGAGPHMERDGGR